jgi:hypothetical protein
MSGENILYIPMENGVIGGLQAKEVVFQSSNVFDITEGIPYNLQTWARQYLNENPALLNGAVECIVSKLKFPENYLSADCPAIKPPCAIVF